MSWLDLIKAGSDLYGANGDCCPPVVDPYTFLALIAGIGLIIVAQKRELANIGRRQLRDF